MKKSAQSEKGSVIICAVLTLLIVSLIGANVLLNCTTRYNASSKQVKAWKEALYAAEAGGDVAFASCRKIIWNSSTFASTFVTDGWTVGASPTPGPAYYKTLTLGEVVNGTASLSSTVTVDRVATASGFDCFRIRSYGTAKLFGLPRVGMDDRMNTTTRGDSLVRKIDFNYNHFKAAYGDGDGNGAAIQTVSNPQITRRIETVVVPVWAFTGALKALGSFDGPGSAGEIDSWDSARGAYTFVANTPASPYYKDSRDGDVAVGTSSFSQGGPIYGNLTTNGGNITHTSHSISGTIDNNVPISAPTPFPINTSSWTSTNSSTLTASGTSWSTATTYVYNTSAPDLTINGGTVAGGNPNAGSTAEVYIKVYVNGNVGDVTIAKGVNAQIYFTGNLSTKARDLSNLNVDGAAGVYNSTGTASTTYSRAGHMQFYGMGTNQTISINPPGDAYFSIYAPNANMTMHGNPDVYGAIVVNNFSGNGNTGFHYDKQLAALGGIPLDYQVASYIEDVR